MGCYNFAVNTCPRCRRAYDDGIRFCPTDGSPIPQLPESVDPYIGKVLMGHIEIGELAGRGAMGTVYKATQTNMARTVAVKILRRDLLEAPGAVPRFLREARAAARLSHPNIVTVHLVGETDDGVPYMVMEFVDGWSLATLCEKEHVLDFGRAIKITRQIASALGEAHAHGIVHRDLKPENILLVDKRRDTDFVKVLDFGIAKIIRDELSQGLSRDGTIFGTPHFIAPEQAAGTEVDARADLYSLGVILFRMVTGQLPFDGTSGMQVLMRHLKDAPPKPRSVNPAVPVALEKIILRALEKDRGERWQDAEELIGALDDVEKNLEDDNPGRTLFGVAPGSAIASTPPLARREPSMVTTAPAKRGARTQGQQGSIDAPPATPLPPMGPEESAAPVAAQAPRPSGSLPPMGPDDAAPDELASDGDTERETLDDDDETRQTAADDEDDTRESDAPDDAIPDALTRSQEISARASGPIELSTSEEMAASPRRSRAALWVVLGAVTVGAGGGVYFAVRASESHPPLAAVDAGARPHVDMTPFVPEAPFEEHVAAEGPFALRLGFTAAPREGEQGTVRVTLSDARGTVAGARVEIAVRAHGAHSDDTVTLQEVGGAYLGVIPFRGAGRHHLKLIVEPRTGGRAIKRSVTFDVENAAGHTVALDTSKTADAKKPHAAKDDKDDDAIDDSGTLPMTVIGPAGATAVDPHTIGPTPTVVQPPTPIVAPPSAPAITPPVPRAPAPAPAPAAPAPTPPAPAPVAPAPAPPPAALAPTPAPATGETDPYRILNNN